jgi:hypothetical protein
VPLEVLIWYGSEVCCHVLLNFLHGRKFLSHILRRGKSQNSNGARSGEYCGCVMVGILFFAKKNCIVRKV